MQGNWEVFKFVCQVEDRWFDPSESFGEAIEILDRRSWPPCVGSGPLVSASCSPSRGTGLPASPDQGCLFLLLRLGRREVSAAGR